MMTSAERNKRYRERQKALGVNRSAYMREWRARNAEHVRELSRRSYAKHIHKRRLEKVEYYQVVVKLRDRTPEAQAKEREKKRLRRQMLKTGTVTLLEWRAICERHHHCCAWCGRSTDLTQDHIVPLSLGGKHVPSNVQPLCRSCNASKGRRVA